MADLSWQDEALCRDDPEMWFPDTGQSDTASTALHICRAHCPVRAQCYAWAVESKLNLSGTVIGGERWVTKGGKVQPSKKTLALGALCWICRGSS